MSRPTNEELNDPTKQDLILNGLNYEDVMYFTKSQVVMKLLSTVISSLGEGEESLPIVLPSELKTDGEGNEDNWKNWAMDHNGDYKQGEFAKLILIMYMVLRLPAWKRPCSFVMQILKSRYLF